MMNSTLSRPTEVVAAAPGEQAEPVVVFVCLRTLLAGPRVDP